MGNDEEGGIGSAVVFSSVFAVRSLLIVAVVIVQSRGTVVVAFPGDQGPIPGLAGMGAGEGRRLAGRSYVLGAHTWHSVCQRWPGINSAIVFQLR